MLPRGCRGVVVGDVGSMRKHGSMMMMLLWRGMAVSSGAKASCSLMMLAFDQRRGAGKKRRFRKRGDVEGALSK